MREEEAGRALVVADRIKEDGQVEGGHRLHLEEHVAGHDLVVHLDAGGGGGETPARVRLGAGGELPALHPVGLGVQTLDLPALHEHPRLDEADGVLERPLPGLQVHLQPVAGQALFTPHEDHVLLGHDAPGLGAVRVLRLVEIEAIGLDAGVAGAEVDQAAGLVVSLRDLFLAVRAQAHLARGEALAGLRRGRLGLGLLRGRSDLRVGGLGRGRANDGDQRGDQGGDDEEGSHGSEARLPRRPQRPRLRPRPCPSRGSLRPRG